jgi:hypothetical protein
VSKIGALSRAGDGTRIYRKAAEQIGALAIASERAAGVSDAAFLAQARMATTAMMKAMGGNCTNIAVLLERYANNLIKMPTRAKSLDRVYSHWEAELRSARAAAAGLIQTAFASDLAPTAPTSAAWKQANATPRRDAAMQRLAKVLGVTPVIFFLWARFRGSEHGLSRGHPCACRAGWWHRRERAAAGSVGDRVRRRSERGMGGSPPSRHDRP